MKIKITNKATITISKHNGKIKNISVIAPIWDRVGSDNKIYVSLPFLNIETYGIDEMDCDRAIEEAIQCFCIASEECGKGIEHELKMLGWSKAMSDDASVSKWHLIAKNAAFDFVMNTGSQTALSLDMNTSDDTSYSLVM